MASSDSELTIYPRLRGLNVLITGASSGIGEAAAKHFAACGSNLILFARRKERLDQLSANLKEAFPGVSVWTGVVDVRKPTEIQTELDRLPEGLRNIDVLVNNAGLAKGVADTGANLLEDIDQVIDTNVKGMLYVLRAIVPLMKSRASGTIINISSIAGLEAYRNGSIYCASKSAVHALTSCLRKEVAAYPIRVATISPGMVETEFSVVRFGDKSKADSFYSDVTPLVAVDVADTIVYLASRPAHV